MKKRIAEDVYLVAGLAVVVTVVAVTTPVHLAIDLYRRVRSR